MTKFTTQLEHLFGNFARFVSENRQPSAGRPGSQEEDQVRVLRKIDGLPRDAPVQGYLAHKKNTPP